MTTTTTKRLRKPVQQTPANAAEAIEKHSALHPVSIANVPDASVHKQYVSRSFDNGNGSTIQDLKLFHTCYKEGFNILIEGPTGPGKTMATRAYCAKKGLKLARINSNNGIDKAAIFGKYVPDGQGGFHWVDGAVTHVVRHGGVILINEANFIPERVSTVLFGLLDGNREIVLDDKDGEVVRVHRGKGKCWCELADCDSKRVLIIADMNPDYAGTRELNAALRNRFQIQLVWDYDPQVEAKLVSSSKLLELAAQIRQDDSYETPVSTNMLMEFERLAALFSLQFAVNNFVSHFRTDEREPIKLVCNAHAEGLEADFKAVKEDDEDEEPDDTTDTADDEEDDYADFFYAEED